MDLHANAVLTVRQRQRVCDLVATGGNDHRGRARRRLFQAERVEVGQPPAGRAAARPLESVAPVAAAHCGGARARDPARAKKILRIPVTSVLAHSPDGWFLFDVGLGDSFRNRTIADTIFCWGAPEFATEGDPLIESLARCNVDARELSGIALSHLHLDHSGGLSRFQGGPPVYVQNEELEFAQSSAATPTDFYWASDYSDDAIRWHTISGDAQIAAGIRAISSKGHSPGHMSFMIETLESGTWLFAFDAIPLAANLERDRPNAYATRAEDEPQLRTAHDRLVALGQEPDVRLVPGHCSTTWASLMDPPAYYR